MPKTDGDIEEIEDQDEDEEDLEDVDEDDEDVDAALSLSDEEDDPVEESLEALRDRRPSAVRRSSEEINEDDLMALSSERDQSQTMAIPDRVDPLKDRQEFVCSNCHLVKARSQLADRDRMLCRDCV